MLRAVCPLILLATAAIAEAAPGDPVDLVVRYPYLHVTHRVNADGTATVTTEYALTLLKESALNWGKRASVSYSTSAQTAEVLAAYTKKADGRRIDVPKNNYQMEVNRGRGENSPVYDDTTTMGVLFPDVAVGDTVVLSYKLVQTEPLFPGHYSFSQFFGPEQAYDDVRVRVEYPASLWVRHSANGVGVKKGTAGKGWKSLDFSYANRAPRKSERENWSVRDPDRDTGFSFSTFRDYGEIAAAYGARALPKAAVTPQIEKLAAEIVGEARDPREQARALYTWVATKITYAGNCIGIGAVVPRDLPMVLENKIGDCKDHATLLEALLAARGIDSIQALVNAGSTYRLAKVPVVSSVNHVMNYIPSLDLYVDSTSSSTPFGSLPGAAQGKPVLWVENYRAGTRTPVPPPEANSHRVTTNMKLAADGRITGTLEVFQQGSAAAGTRAWARRLTRDVEADLVKDMFRSQDMIGSGTFTKDDPTELGDSYHYRIDFDAEKYVKLPGAGAFYVYPAVGGGSPVQGQLQFSGEIEKTADVACGSGIALEEYRIELPAGLQILSVPDDVTLGGGSLKYEARYELDGHVLTVRRSLEDRTPGPVCTPKYAAAYKAFGDQVVEDLKSQVLYKLPKKG
jgi:transglutaminase-like putative cysteine protease